MNRYVVTLTAEERRELSGLIAAGRAAARKLAHARILLKADESDGAPGWCDAEIAEAVEVSGATVAAVAAVRRRFVEQGLAAALDRRKASRPPHLPKSDGAAEARLIAVACSRPPDGRSAWTLRLLADRLVELHVVESISYETVRQALKKTNSSRG